MSAPKNATGIEKKYHEIKDALADFDREQNGLSWDVASALWIQEELVDQVKDYDAMWEAGAYIEIGCAIEHATRAVRELRQKLDKCRRWKKQEEE